MTQGTSPIQYEIATGWRRAPTVRAYLELLRLPNVFTAMADIVMGFLLVHGGLAPASLFLLLLGASSALYLAGMVLNDVFDIEQDLQERPHRPIPSGRVQVSRARLLGAALIALGVACGLMTTLSVRGAAPVLVAIALSAAVIAYDRILKRTPLAPLGMGACRFLNVLLGMSTALLAWKGEQWLVAAGVGVYTVGVTMFARTEARESRRGNLVAAAGVIVAGITMLVLASLWLIPTVASTARLLVWSVPVLWLAWFCGRAIAQPVPQRVQAAIKECIIGFIVLDACLCFAATGWFWALAVLFLLLPALFLGRWIYST